MSNPYPPPDSEVALPKWEVPDADISFPEGYYLLALGKITPIYAEGDNPATSAPEAITNELWVLRYLGKDIAVDQQIRITIKEGNVIMSPKGVRISERYPNPAKMPTLAWRSSAFFGKFGCLTEVDTGKKDPDDKPITKKYVDWSLVKAAVGTMFKVNIIYQKSPKNGKNYRNLDYESIELTGQKVSASDMKAIEVAYAAMRAKDEAKSTGSTPPPGAADLPF